MTKAEEIKKSLEAQKKALADAVEDFDSRLKYFTTFNRLVLAANRIGYCLEEIAKLEAMLAKVEDNADNATEEIDADEYAVSVDAQEIAINAEIENAKAAVIVDLSNAAGSANAEKQILAALQSNSLTDSDYALVKVAQRMISFVAEDDNVADVLVAEGKIDREIYEMQQYTSERQMRITLNNDAREWFDATDLMTFAGVNSSDYYIDWGKGLIRGFSFNRNAVAKAVIYALNLVGINADGKTDYSMVEEIDAANDSAAKVEDILDEIGNGKFAIESIESRIEKIAEEFNEVKDTAEQSKAKEIQFLIDCANEEIDFAKQRIADATKEIKRKNIGGALAEVAGMVERIEYAEETADRANSILAEVEEVNAENADIEKLFTVITQNGETYGLPDGDIAVHGNKIFDLHGHELASFDTAKDAEIAADELTAAFENGYEVFDFSATKKKNPLKAKVAEIKNRPRKSVIDWTDAISQNVTLPEIFKAQKELKKFLKLGQIDLAENVFTMLKTLCKNYRVAA